MIFSFFMLVQFLENTCHFAMSSFPDSYHPPACSQPSNRCTSTFFRFLGFEAVLVDSSSRATIETPAILGQHGGVFRSQMQPANLTLVQYFRRFLKNAAPKVYANLW